MNDLAELQNWMARLLVRRRALHKDAEVTAQAAVHATGNERLLPVEQVDIYREQFWLRHTASLVEDFPGLGGILGQSEWERLAEEYLVAHPPDSHTLRDLGRHLPDFIRGSEWLPERELCEDMARLEWAYVEAFDAADARPLDPAKLSSIPEEAWQNARVLLDPALRLLRVRYPVAELRKKLRDSPEPVPIPGPSAAALVVYRRERSLYWEAAGDGAFALLEGLRDGLSLVQACEKAIERHPAQSAVIEASIGDWFQDWGRRGWIVDVVVD